MADEISEKPRQFERRKPAILKRIKNISKDDSRVRFIGTIVELDNESGVLLIDDGSQISVIATPEMVETFKISSVVGIIGTILPYSEGVEVRAEIIQDMSKLNKEIYEKFMDLVEQGKVI